MTEPEANIVLFHWQGIRRDLGAVLDSQARTHEVIGRLHRDIGELKRDVTELKNDAYSPEREGLNRHTEMLRALERIEDLIPNAVQG